MTEQKIIATSHSLRRFYEEVKVELKNGWKFVPTSLIAEDSRYIVILEKEVETENAP